MFRYSVSIKWSDEDEGFIATVPELEGLSAFGETREEAARELLQAAEAFIETMKKAGEPLPEPFKVVPYSGQTRLRMPRRLHARLAVEAEMDGVSLNTYLVSLLSERQGMREAAKGPEKPAFKKGEKAAEAQGRYVAGARPRTKSRQRSDSR